MISPSQSAYYEAHSPAQNNATAALIDDTLTMRDLVPLDLCRCDGADDGAGLCRMHAAVDCIVERAHATGKRWRARGAVERLVRRVAR
jgi:hypothetical protein